MGKRLTSTLDLAAIYDYMYSSLGRIMPVDGFLMSVIDENLERLDIQLYMEDKQKMKLDSVDIHNKASLLGWCFLNNKEIFSGNILVDYESYINEKLLYAGDPLMQSVIYIPIQFQGKAMGVLSVQSKKQQAFDEYHLELLKALSAYLAIAINNAVKSKVLVDEIEMRKSAQLELETLNNHLKDLSERDGLTGVANRHRLEAHLKELAMQRNQTIYAYMIDIDFFKNYNDTYGHLKGDEVLIEVAQVLEHTFAKFNGFFARYGGEEFVGILKDMSFEEAKLFTETALGVVRALKIPHEGSILGELTISLGMATNSKSMTFDKTISYADRALYLSKRTGRNKASIHE